MVIPKLQILQSKPVTGSWMFWYSSGTHIMEIILFPDSISDTLYVMEARPETAKAAKILRVDMS